MACANVLVAIDATSKRLPGVVQVKYLEAIQADFLFELPRCLRSRLASYVVSRREQVTRIEADAESLVMCLRKNRSQVFKCRSEGGSLACGLLEQHQRLPSRPLGEQRVEGPSDELETTRAISARVAAGMQDYAQ